MIERPLHHGAKPVLELPQPLHLALILAWLALSAVLVAALVLTLRRLRELGRQRADHQVRQRTIDPVEHQGEALGWITRDFLRFLRRIHSPIKGREIVTVLKEFVGSTFDPAAGVILLRRSPALSEPGRENQLVVATAPGTRIRTGSVIQLGEGDLGYVAQTRRAMDRRELDQTPSAGGDAGAIAGFHPELAAPMAVGSKTLGVIGISRPRRSRARAKELLDLIAQTAALALENSLVLHQIRTAASADPLTGAYNKGALMHQLDELVAAAAETDQQLAVLLFDLDHFKNYNDTNGQAAGDELLRLLASLVSDEVRTDDVFGRFGGEEFLLILPGRSAAEAEMTAEKLLQLVRQHDFRGASTQPLGRVTISGGVAVFPDQADDSSELLQAAERALYRAKERGRDRVIVAADLEAGETAPPPAPEAEVEEIDDLKQIKGIGPAFEQALNEIGIASYRQVAELNWTRIVLVASRLNTFPERIVSERWLQQARALYRRKYGEKI